MNKKIKAIEIEAFRAYETKQCFDFIHESTGEIADLVVIYAPNGYGKTSFFDAIEWSITGEIGRISSNRAISEEAKVGRGSILRNRDSDELQGIVRIIGEDSEFFESKTVKLDHRMNNDYKPSKENSVTPEFEGLLDEKKTFCSTNMLAHDKITEFLQTYTAADKSKALELFWDEKNESEILEKILDLEKELEKQKKKLRDDMNEAEESLKKHTFETSKEKQIIQLMKEYNRSNKKNGLLYTDIEDMDSLIESWSGLSEMACIEREHISEIHNKIDVALLEFPQFCSTQKKFEDNRIQKNMLKEKIKNINIFKQKEEQKNILSLEIKKMSKIIKSFDKYSEVALLLEQEKIKEDTLEKKKPTYLRQIITIKTKIRKEKEIIKKENKTIQENSEILNDMDEDFLIFMEKKKFVENGILRKTKLQKLKEMRVDKRKIINENMANLEKFVGGQTEGLNGTSAVDIRLAEIEDSISNLKKANEDLKKGISILEDNKDQEISLYENIDKLILIGKEIINSQKSQECPLCNAQYKEYSKLIARVNKKQDDNIRLVQLSNEITKQNKLHKENTVRIVLYIEEKNLIIKQLKEKYSSQLEKQNTKIRTLEINLGDLESVIERNQSFCVKLANKYMQKDINIKEQSEFEAGKKLLQEKYKSMQSIINESNETVLIFEAERIELEAMISKIDYKLVGIKETIRKCNRSMIYIITIRFLKENAYLEGYSTNSDIKKVLLDKEKFKKELFEMLVSQLNDLQQQILEPFEIVTKKYNEILLEEKSLQLNYKEYISRCKELIGIEDLEVDKIEDKLLCSKRDYNLKIAAQAEVIKVLRKIILGLNTLALQGMWLDTKNQYTHLKVKQELITEKLTKLAKSKEFAQQYINDRINKYFDSEAINEVYSKLDPHPTISRIKFVPSITKKTQKIYINTFGEKAKSQLSPVLYLSSAQVNVLSLCIFLAKVLKEQRTTLNTIFMDDPIQHLDGINLLAFIDLLRMITTDLGRQIVISTHNESFYKLIKVKMDKRYYSSKFIVIKDKGTYK